MEIHCNTAGNKTIFIKKKELECIVMYTVLQVKESITSTMYEIARRSTIPADNVGHKVTNYLKF